MLTQALFAVAANRRSREGAWIEIRRNMSSIPPAQSRSRKGAWIEIRLIYTWIETAKSRSRKGAWIEINGVSTIALGLRPSLPRGSVD